MELKKLFAGLFYTLSRREQEYVWDVSVSLFKRVPFPDQIYKPTREESEALVSLCRKLSVLYPDALQLGPQINLDDDEQTVVGRHSLYKLDYIEPAQLYDILIAQQ